jgi:oligopeptidase B
VPCPDTPSTSWVGANPEFSATSLRYEYSSLVTPRSVLDVDMDTGDRVLRKRQQVLGDFSPERYTSERLWATADDGTRVPVSVVRRTTTPLDGSAPCLLYGYGAYEHSIDPVFSSIRLSLLDRGVVFAIAHVRGGGELGRHWYEDGKLAAKPNSFTDFVACARMLVGCGRADSRRLVARGGSAGGLLVGAAMNLAPDAFRAVVAEVPFVDCLTTMLDDSLPLTVIERDEWGDPEADPEIYRIMKGYSPYDNVHPGRYPDVLATAGLEDPRVGYWEPAKWVQRLRAADPANRVLLRVELQAGHGGPTGRYDAWRDEAFVLAFVLQAMGIER